DVVPSMSIAGVAKSEGNSGTTAFGFAVTLSKASTLATSVAWTTVDGTASAGTDYVASSGTLTIPAGSTSATITVMVVGDALYESSETLTVQLSGAVNASIGTATAVGIITNDDTAPTLSIGNVVKAEGNGGTTVFVFPIALSKATGTVTTGRWETSDGTAAA